MEQLADLGIIPVDYSVLESLLAGYASPRHKIADLEKSGKLVRLKRGLYVVSPKVSGKLLSTELMANHIYGPSYVSMESALRHHGLIPEKVYTVQSMTLKRSRQFNNAIGRFNYTFCPEDYYSIGINQQEKEGYTYMIASPEKALCDLIAYTPNVRLRYVKTLQLYLEEDIRLDMEAFYKMDVEIFKQCAFTSKKKNDITNLIKLLE
ncbi:type IV toxin-antitoxin system AbiEi family antitoxin domain-containing protein [Bacteroides sedimenti]|uniref:Transcriptional regulator, AbiEi antitoxin, Type IV TA system n=1 Tax=Bacteroides sedimenti TaxID=2136147 RepID=A0ABN6Z2P7_9BACE